MKIIVLSQTKYKENDVIYDVVNIYDIIAKGVE